MKSLKLYVITVLFLTTGCNKNDDSTPQEIGLQNGPPLSFNLLEVPDGATEVDVTPTLSWESAKNPEGGEVTYDLYLGKGVNPTTLFQSGISNTSYEIEERLNLISDYYWKVVAKDAEGQTSQSSIHSFTTRNLKFPEQPVQTTSGFPLRINHTSLSFNNKIWILSGNEYEGQGYDDVWSSEDGSVWSEAGNDVLFRSKFGHTSVVYDNKMWILGGYAINEEDDTFITHDVWSSSDGLTWNNMTSYTDFFPARTLHTSVVHDNKIFIIGGRDDEGVKNDIWQYNGGWSQVAVSSSLFSAREGHASVIFDDKIWVIGGYDGSERKNDVWYSNDGSNWTLATAEADFPPMDFHKAVVFDGKMWLVSSFYSTGKYWYSDNGIDWSPVEIQEELRNSYNQSATVHDGKLYLAGGLKIDQIVNDIWILE